MKRFLRKVVAVWAALALFVPVLALPQPAQAASAPAPELPIRLGVNGFSRSPSLTNQAIPLKSGGKKAVKWEVTLNGKNLGQIGHYDQANDRLVLSRVEGLKVDVVGESTTDPGHMIWRNAAGTHWRTKGQLTDNYEFRGRCSGSADAAPSQCPGLFPDVAYNTDKGKTEKMPIWLMGPGNEASSTPFDVKPPDYFYVKGKSKEESFEVATSEVLGIKIVDGKPISDGVHIVQTEPGPLEIPYLIEGRGFMRVSKALTSQYNREGYDYDHLGNVSGYAEGRNYFMSVLATWTGYTYQYIGSVKVYYGEDPKPVLAAYHAQTDAKYQRSKGDEIQSGKPYFVDNGGSLPVELRDLSTNADPDNVKSRLLYKSINGSKPIVVKQQAGAITFTDNLPVGTYDYWLELVTVDGRTFKSNVVTIVVKDQPNIVLPVAIIGHKNGSSLTVTSVNGRVGDDFKLTGAPSYDPMNRPIVRYLWYVWKSGTSFDTAQKVANTGKELTKAQQDQLFPTEGTYNVRLYVQVLHNNERYPAIPTQYDNYAQITLNLSPAISQYPQPVLGSSTHTVGSTAEGGKYIDVTKSALFNINGSGSSSPNGTIATYVFNWRKVDGTPSEASWSQDEKSTSPNFSKTNLHVEGTYQVRLAVIDSAGKDSRDNPDVNQRYDYMEIRVGAIPGNPPVVDGLVETVAYKDVPFHLIDLSTDPDHNKRPDESAGVADSYLNYVTWSIVEQKYDTAFGGYAHYLQLHPTKRLEFAYADQDGNLPPPPGTKMYLYRFMYPFDFEAELAPTWTATPFLRYEAFVDNSGQMKALARILDMETGTTQDFTLTEDPNRDITITFNKLGVYTIMQRVTDEENHSKTKIYTVNVIENKPPKAEFDTPKTAGRVKPYPVLDYSSDPDDGIKTYTWHISHNGCTSSVHIDRETGARNETNPACTRVDLSGLKDGDGRIVYTDLGNYDIWLEVADYAGQKDQTDKLRVVVLNTPPEASITTDPVVYVGEYVDAELTATDYDGTITQETVRINGAALSAAELADLKADKHYFTEEGTYTFEYTVRDNDGAANEEPARSQTIVRKPIPTAIWVLDEAQSTLKENRRIIVDASLSESLSEASDRYPIDWSKTEWDVYPVDGLDATDINTKLLDGGKRLGLQTKKPGTVGIRVRVQNSGIQRMPETGYWSEWYEHTLTIGPDLEPVADLKPDSVRFYRNPQNGNKAQIVLSFTGGSVDNDTIASIKWYVRRDSNDNKKFDEGWTLFHTGTQTQVSYTTTGVGLYQFRVEVTEEFGQPYYAEWVTAADRRSGNSDWKIADNVYQEERDLGVTVAIVDNIAPEATFDVFADPTANMLFLIEESQWNSYFTKDAAGKDQIDYLLELLRMNGILADIEIHNMNFNVPSEERSNH